MIPFFSIIVPLYNASLTLAGLLKSLSLQTFKNFEVIFIDGASKDGTVKMLQDFINDSHSQSVYVSEQDKGIYDAMNKGIDMAQGKWLYFIGADDFLADGTVLQRIYEIATTGNYDLINGNVIGQHSKTKYAASHLSNILSEGIHHQSIFYRRETFNYTGKYDLRFKIAADYHLTLKIFSNVDFKTRYTDLDIASFGENGISSTTYDYTFYSYHYKLLAELSSLNNVIDKRALLKNATYSCFVLAKNKRNVLFGWKNIFYYITKGRLDNLSYQIKTLIRMLYWTFYLPKQ